MKKAEERRRNIVGMLSTSDKAIAGGEFSKILGVSRQIIVMDISTLREQGYDILSTHTGYVIKGFPLKERIFKVRHTSEQTKDELSAIVALGGTVIDVHVYHEVYGKISAMLNVFSERGIKKFMDGMEAGRSTELMGVTNGYHYHTVRAEEEEMLDKIEKVLEEKGYLIKE